MRVKRIALVAHDNRKKELAEWVKTNYRKLISHQLICTGTTGKLVESSIKEVIQPNEKLEYSIQKVLSGPLGGDQQLGAMISQGGIDIMIFFWDPMQPQPHEVDIKALLRISVLYNIPCASSQSTADFIISSDRFEEDYTPKQTDYSNYINRSIQ